MSLTTNKMMVKIRIEGKKLADCDFWTKSDPYLLICRPNRAGKGLIHVSLLVIDSSDLKIFYF